MTLHSLLICSDLYIFQSFCFIEWMLFYLSGAIIALISYGLYARFCSKFQTDAPVYALCALFWPVSLPISIFLVLGSKLIEWIANE